MKYLIGSILAPERLRAERAHAEAVEGQGHGVREEEGQKDPGWGDWNVRDLLQDPALSSHFHRNCCPQGSASPCQPGEGFRAHSGGAAQKASLTGMGERRRAGAGETQTPAGPAQAPHV